MVNELEKIKELEAELIKVRLTITEKEQEKEKIKKTVNTLAGAGAFFLGFTLLAYFGENKLIMFIPGSIAVLPVFFAFKKTFEISKLDLGIREAKKKKKQLENELDNLNYLAKRGSGYESKKG